MAVYIPKKPRHHKTMELGHGSEAVTQNRLLMITNSHRRSIYLV